MTIIATTNSIQLRRPLTSRTISTVAQLAHSSPKSPHRPRAVGENSIRATAKAVSDGFSLRGRHKRFQRGRQPTQRLTRVYKARNGTADAVPFPRLYGQHPVAALASG